MRRIAIALALILLAPFQTSATGDALVLGKGRQPQVAVSPGGSAFITYVNGQKIQCVSLAEGAQTILRPVEVASPPHVAVGMRRGPRIAATSEAIVITAISGERGGGKDGDVFAWRSVDDGATWAAVAKPLSSVAGAAREGLHGMAAAADGQMFCVWLDLRNASRGGGTEVWGARSGDHGRTWSDDFLVYRSPEKSVCQCCHPSVTFGPDGTTVAVMFRNELRGNRDMYLIESRDGGKTFGEARKQGEGTWELNACPMDGGMVTFTSALDAANSKPTPVSVWRRETRVFLSSPGRPERAIGEGVQPWVTAKGMDAYVVWVTGRPGALMMRKGGGPPVKLADAASDPSATASQAGKGSVVLAWESGDVVMVQRVDD